jgi:long-chain fatty acid transport protein
MEATMFLKLMRGGIMISVVLTLLCSVTFGDEYHYNNFLIGDRASGMGGAYTAVSDDPTGLYYNPAGIVYSTGKNLSASVNSFYNLQKKYKAVIGGQDWQRNSSSLLPNFFGITQPLGRLQFGFSYAVPDSIREDQDQVFYSLPNNIDQYVINFNNDDNTYNFGPSLAYEVNSSFSVGATLYLHHRSNQWILNQLVIMQDGSYEWSNQYFELVERGVRPILGVMISPVDKLTIGLSIAKTFLYSSSINDQIIRNDITPPIDFPLNMQERKYPYEIHAGVAYFASSSLLITADGNFFTKIEDPAGDRVFVFNGAVGIEYYLDKHWAMRGGLFSNMANTPELQAGSTVPQDEKIDYYGLSASISNFTRNTSITLGGNISKGSGKAQIFDGISDLQDVDSLGWTIFLSSSYSY